MVQWFIDSKSKVPLYIQLKDQIKYYISTGALRADDQLPPVNRLAKELGINFETIRKAYKELERDGLITMKRGEGTFVTLQNSTTSGTRPLGRNGQSSRANLEEQLASASKGLINQYVHRGVDLNEVRKVVNQAIDELERYDSSPRVIFAECNQFQVGQISGLLTEELRLNVEPVLLVDLPDRLPSIVEDGRTATVITTGFHVDDVRHAVGELPLSVEILITNLHPDTRRRLEALGENARYGFICRDQESAVLYKDLLKAELGFEHIDLASCTLTEADKVKDILTSADAILTSPPVYEEVKKLSPPGKPVFNLFERVDPMSLKVVKDRVLRDR